MSLIRPSIPESAFGALIWTVVSKIFRDCSGSVSDSCREACRLALSTCQVVAMLLSSTAASTTRLRSFHRGRRTICEEGPDLAWLLRESIHLGCPSSTLEILGDTPGRTLEMVRIGAPG
jgi:hypothetical protein